jgi:hypothetical protein
MNQTPDVPRRRDDRNDLETQTEPYLQEVLGKAAEIDAATQTDSFLDRPATPPSFPGRWDVDVETQTDEPELFDFDFEVRPIVSTIIAKMIEQSFLEVHEEAELASLRRHREAIERRRNIELADIQRLDEGDRRKFEEKQMRIRQRLEHEAAQCDLRQRLAARGFGASFSGDLMCDTISLLERRGYFYDEVEREIKMTFLPWLAKAMEEANETTALVEAIKGRVRAETVAFHAKLKTAAIKHIDGRDAGERRDRLATLREMFVEDRAAARIREARERAKPKKKEEAENDGEEHLSDE